ncbi:MAG TPA: glycoside hydrolase family 15 protein [Solirubrobacteraceae bacterium]|nr:glycoside hydrolase family 15 protein [Solirubrobacteraceae bacterium]
MPTSRSNGFAPLSAYALLGDLRATALVADDGAIDWLALPNIDSAPVCAGLLDPERGGSITLAPSVPHEVTRRYLPGTMLLETTFTTADGVMRLTDVLTFGALGTLPWTELARSIEVSAGEVPVAWTVSPGHGLTPGRSPWAHEAQGVPVIMVGDHRLAVITDGLGEPSLTQGRVGGRAVLRAGDAALLAVVGTEGEPVRAPSPDEIRERVAHTAQTWRHWSRLLTYRGRWQDMVLRSALTLKALTLKANGAIAGAATTSLPEQPGGRRNFDYRFAWIRDSSFALDAMSRLGLSEELHAGVSWLLGAVSHQAPALRVFYALDGRPVSPEMTEVANVPGYRGSLPVNVGNGAADQTQLGAYGDLLDAAWHYARQGGILGSASASMLAGMSDHVCDIWPTPDAGLWELGTPEHYTSSKLGCWVALDRAIKLSDAGQMTSPHQPRWRMERDRIRAWIDEHCWSEVKQSYTFHAGTDKLDAAVLLMARFGYCDGQDPRLAGTIDAIAAELGAGPGLLYRYSGQQDQEGAFLACSCWLVEALVHAGRAPEAERWFNALVAHASDVGLLSEEIDPDSGELLGNLPQALTHLAVINAAITLDAALAPSQAEVPLAAASPGA